MKLLTVFADLILATFSLFIIGLFSFFLVIFKDSSLTIQIIVTIYISR